MASHYRIVAFGDSMTECRALPPSRRWPALLQRRLNRTFAEPRFEVINAGVGGNTSREGLARLEREVLARRPHLVLVQFGGNDATPDPARSVTLAEFSRNLQQIRRRLERQGAATAWLTFPPVVDAWHSWSDPANQAARARFYPAGGGDRFLHAYRQRTRALARRHGAVLVDLYAGLQGAMERAGCARYTAPDGVHFTVAGSRLASQLVFAALEPVLGRLARRRLPAGSPR